MSAHHPRLTPVRPDLAAETMRGIVDAPHYVKGEARIVFDGIADLRRAPVPDAPLDTQALHGEIFIEYDRDEEGWSWGQLQRDSYVGYVPSNALTQDIAEPTHRVSVLRTFLYGGPSIKLPPMATLSMGSRVTILDRKDQFAITHRGHYLIADHCGPLTETASDFVSVAEQFIGIPYFWGGKTSIGLDCSGLVQVSLDAAGHFAPRDTDMQEHAVGEALPITPDLSGLQRGDLIFWKGHVGIMRDATQVLHASGHQMLVVSESLQGTADRILSKGAGPITSIKRLA